MLTQTAAAIDAFEQGLFGQLVELYVDLVEAGHQAANKNLRAVLAVMRAAAPKIEDPQFDKTNPKAVEYARQHAAELIDGLKKTDREKIKELVEEAFEDQVDVRELADQIDDIIGDEARAETIARTETMEAANRGQQMLWEEAQEDGRISPDAKKEWIVTPDDRLCPVCEPMDGEQVDLDEDFDVDGEAMFGPPAHPNCRCTLGLSV